MTMVQKGAVTPRAIRDDRETASPAAGRRKFFLTRNQPRFP
jgi:hypothetical protein